MRLAYLLLAFLVLVGASAASVAQAPPDIPINRGKGRPIPGRFVVTLQERVDPRAVARENGVTPDFIYTRVLNGFAGSMSEVARSGLLRDYRVVRIEQDREARSHQTSAWGLDRIDQRALPLDSSFAPAGTGRGVTVYVVDTGIRFDHLEFGGRARPGFDSIGDGRGGADCDGHGTHVAGTIGGRSYGVARAVDLVAVRVLNCEGSGTMSGIIAGLDWIAVNGRRPAVVNMSLGGDGHASTDDAVRRLAAIGYPIVVAAGNDGADACGSSPARAAEAITVAASDRTDARPTWSNYGACVDLFAPGASIASAWHTSSTALASASGTSMAAPHVAGAAALILEANPQLSASGVADSLSRSATPRIVTNALSARNHLLFTAPATSSAPPPSPSGDGVTINGTSGDDVISPAQSLPGQPSPTAGSDTINGLAGNDRLDGGAGADRLTGGPGDDTYFIDNAADVVVEISGGGFDLVYTSVSYALSDDVERLGVNGFTTSHAINLTGNGLDNEMWGNNGANILNGGAGADIMTGHGGNDIYFVDNGGDVIVETFGGGLDLVYTSVSYVLRDDVERLSVNGVRTTHAISLTGNARSNEIWGNDGDNVIDGRGGADILHGNGGADTFAFTTSIHGGVDQIIGFEAGIDRIALDDAEFAGLSVGALAPGAFRIGPSAQDGDDRILYDPATGALYFDADGNGSGAAVRFATLSDNLGLTAANFRVI